ncbi:unnamed protein product [Triticum turgidum subsp. durum]|uniref:Uncharacterized protein n=1 Tax=Triticum turgidum subsp. durum TaxID=4567 RepID=A0A9R1Q0L4_TRITD|nr:unnamed protein product [Triticum turgidum subsp. durum]
MEQHFTVTFPPGSYYQHHRYAAAAAAAPSSNYDMSDMDDMTFLGTLLESTGHASCSGPSLSSSSSCSDMTGMGPGAPHVPAGSSSPKRRGHQATAAVPIAKDFIGVRTRPWGKPVKQQRRVAAVQEAALSATTGAVVLEDLGVEYLEELLRVSEPHMGHLHTTATASS